jgi:hypothetical protein
MKQGGRRLSALVLVIAAGAEATTVAFRSDEQLFDEASVVVLGTVSRREALLPRGGTPVTAYELQAIECFKGCRPGETLVALTPGFNFENESGLKVPVAGSPALVPGERVLMYLTRTRAEGPLVPISLGLSIYTMRFDPLQKRYLAHRQVDGLSILSEARAGKDAAPREVQVASERVESELTAALRKLAQERSHR